MTLEQVKDRLSMEGLSYGVDKDRNMVTIYAGDGRMVYFIDDKMGLVSGYPLPQSFDSIIDQARRIRAQSFC